MSKKKASGNTMTLKDFHGGSIPTDLPLPSAPGVVPRSTDRPGYDRTSWGNPMGRSDHRRRPNSSPSIRHFDDKTPFLTHSANIGRNFDEDERKPLDGHSAPRRMVKDDSFKLPNSRLEVKSEPLLTGRVTGWQGLAPLNGAGSSYTAHSGISTQMVAGKSENSFSVAYPNAWGGRKEAAVVVKEPVQSACSGHTAVSKLVYANAVDTVSLGRWQSKVSRSNQTDFEGIKHSEPEIGRSKNYDDILVRGRESSDVMLASHLERGLSIEEGVPGGSKDPADYEKSRDMAPLEVKDVKAVSYTDGFQTARSDGKLPRPQMQPTAPSEVSERPKLKLQPRMKPLENVERPAIDPKKDQQSGISIFGHSEDGSVLRSSKPGLPGSESVTQPAERPKLNLKPRSQPLEQSEGNLERERNAVFGGARPRELVLKQRGTDGINSHEPVQHSDRIKPNVLKTERIPSRQGERPENMPRDVRTTRKFEKDNRGDVDRPEFQRRNWRNNENKRSNYRADERQQQPISTQERHPSPDTWRKPVEPPKAASSDGSGLRYGKAASAVELAQAFSKPFSGWKGDDRFTVQRGILGRTQAPFSRLMRPTARQIDGY